MQNLGLLEDKQEAMRRIGSFHLIELVYPDIIEFMIKKNNDDYFWMERINKDSVTGRPYSLMKCRWVSDSLLLTGVEIIDHGVAGAMTLLLLDKEDREKLFS